MCIYRANMCMYMHAKDMHGVLIYMCCVHGLHGAFTQALDATCWPKYRNGADLTQIKNIHNFALSRIFIYLFI